MGYVLEMTSWTDTSYHGAEWSELILICFLSTKLWGVLVYKLLKELIWVFSTYLCWKNLFIVFTLAIAIAVSTNGSLLFADKSRVRILCFGNSKLWIMCLRVFFSFFTCPSLFYFLSFSLYFSFCPLVLRPDPLCSTQKS